MSDTVPAVQVWMYSPARTCWAVHHVARSKSELDRVLSGITRDRKVRLQRVDVPRVASCIVKPPPPASAARQHRVESAMAMSDRADANKHYKSPGVDTRLMF